MNNRWQNISNHFFKGLLYFFTFLVLFTQFIKLNPNMQNSGLDAAWVWAIPKALMEQLTFGKDLIFTMGPYNSIYTEQYYPGTDFLFFLVVFFYWQVILFR